MSPRFNPALARPLGVGAVALVALSGMNLGSATAVDGSALPTSAPITTDAATEVAVPNTDTLKAKVAEAEKAGVKVTTGDTETRDFSLTEQDQQVKDAEADYKSQIDKLDAAIETQKAHDDNFALAVAARDSIIKQNKSIDASNAQMKAVVDAAQKAHDDAVAKNEEIAKLRAQIQASNDAGLKAQVEADKQYEATVAAIVASNNKIIETNNKSLETNAQKLAEAQKAVDAATPGTDAYNKAVEAYNAVAQQIKQDNQRIADENKAAIEKYNADMAKAQAERQKALDAAAAVEAENAALEQAYRTKMAEYDAKLADYQAKMDEYNRLLNEQTIGADPNVAIVAPDELAYAQPFTVDTTGNNLKSVTTTSAGGVIRSSGGVFNSEYLDLVPVSDGDTVTAVWGERATDIATGRKLDLTITVTDITTAKSDIQDVSNSYNTLPFYTDHPFFGKDAGQITEPVFAVYSNSVDSFSYHMVSGAKLQYTYTYSDTGEPYDHDYYITTGSHDWQKTEGYTPSHDFEFSAPVSNVRATFINKDSYMGATMRDVYGTGSKVAAKAFGVDPKYNESVYPDELRHHDDSGDYVFNRIGVSYLVSNGAVIASGVSYDGSPSDNRYDLRVAEDAKYNWITQHYMSTVQTVAPTAVQPTRPTPPNPDEYTPKVVPTVPEVNIPPADVKELADVQVLAFTPLAPEPFIPQEEPADVPVPPVPDYNPTPKLTVPEEPVKEQAEVDVRYLKLMLQPTDLRITKTVIDNDASDGTIAFRIDGANVGSGTAQEALVTDLLSEGITSIKLSDLTYKGVEADANQARLDGDKLVLKDVAGGDVFSFLVTAEVDPNADVVTNAVKITSPDDPKKGQPGDPQRNDTPGDDTDGWDEETTPVKNQTRVKVNKKMLSFDEETDTITYEVIGLNEKAIAHNVVLEDFGGTGLSNVKVQSFSSTLNGKSSTVVEAPAAEATAEASAVATAEATEAAVVPAPEAPAEASLAAFVAPKASEQDALKATDVMNLDDYVIDGAKVTVDAMGAGETFTAIITASVDEKARTVDNAVGVTTPDDPEAKGKDGSQDNEDVPSDTDGWDKETNELDRPADLKVNKEVVDSDASDYKVSYRITGANLGVGDSPETVIADMVEGRVGLENPVISEVTFGAYEAPVAEATAEATAEASATASASASASAEASVEATATASASATAEATESASAEATEKAVDAFKDRYTVADSGDAITVDDLKAGEQVSYLIEFDVIPGSEAISNAASITSPKSPVDPNGEIQENPDIPGDNDQKDKVTIDPVAPDLKVVKEAVDSDASDGKVSFRITGGNFGTADAPEVRITDEKAEGLKNPVIIESSEGSTVIDEEGVTGIALETLKMGEEASFVVEFEVESGVKEVSNAAFIDSPFDPVDPKGDIEDNPDLPGDKDGKDLTSITFAPELKVDKEVVDADASDGKVSFRITGGNTGTSVESEVILQDAQREGLVNGAISEVKAPEGAVTSTQGEALHISELKPGETASFLITFEVMPDAKTLTNVATIESKDLKPGDGDVQENEGLDADEDQKDKVAIELPEEPAPADPAQPADPADPAAPAPAAPAGPAQATVTVKGESAETGGAAEVPAAGIGAGVLAAGLAGLAGYLNRSRIARLFKREG